MEARAAAAEEGALCEEGSLEREESCPSPPSLSTSMSMSPPQSSSTMPFAPLSSPTLASPPCTPCAPSGSSGSGGLASAAAFFASASLCSASRRWSHLTRPFLCCDCGGLSFRFASSLSGAGGTFQHVMATTPRCLYSCDTSEKASPALTCLTLIAPVFLTAPSGILSATYLARCNSLDCCSLVRPPPAAFSATCTCLDPLLAGVAPPAALLPLPVFFAAAASPLPSGPGVLDPPSSSLRAFLSGVSVPGRASRLLVLSTAWSGGEGLDFGVEGRVSWIEGGGSRV